MKLTNGQKFAQAPAGQVWVQSIRTGERHKFACIKAPDSERWYAPVGVMGAVWKKALYMEMRFIFIGPVIGA